jgi:dTDP-4-dehydrorhamnose 3,5-epimerase
VSGCVYDVAVDLRRSSKTFGKWVGVELSAENQKQLWIPAGFGHAFLTLSDSAEFLYKTTDYYSSASERSIRWDDPQLAITWPKLDVPFSLSEKDLSAKLLAQADVF